MRKKWLIDGHNLLHHDTQLARQLQRRPAEAYGRLCVHVERYAAHSNRHARLMFDGNRVPVQAELHNVQLRFSGGKTADEAIKKILRGGKASSRWILVSDDRDLQFAARKSGVEVVGSRSFYASMKRKTGSAADSSTRRQNHPPEKDPGVEVDDKQVRKMAQLWRLRDELDNGDE